MKKYFYIGALLLLLFEIANVYFIMPMPGSQELDSISLAYFLHSWRWVFRMVALLLLIVGSSSVWSSNKVVFILSVLVVAAICYLTNFKMAADAMFRQTTHLQMYSSTENTVDLNRIVVGVERNGHARAYPIQFLGYHHQVFDTLDGKPILVTYCTVCRTGRVFEPVVNGTTEHFRLVGMNHFNAMFEDASTGSWWRQVNGEAIAGKLKGTLLPEVPSLQMTLKQWLLLYPDSKIMQPDSLFNLKYEGMSAYENGHRGSKLTRRDSASWMAKSWVVGVSVGHRHKAYDWNILVSKHLIHDTLNHRPILLAVGKDGKSIAALERTDIHQQFTLVNDTLVWNENKFTLNGKSLNPAVPDLKKLFSSQEYWHSWEMFQPTTQTYKEAH